MVRQVVLFFTVAASLVAFTYSADARSRHVHHGGFRYHHHRSHHRHGRRFRARHARRHATHAFRHRGSAGGGSGLASWYRAPGNGLTAAHRFLPMGTRLRVVNRANGRSVVVRITDRGPFVRGRVIDLSRGAARAIGVTGVSRVAMQRL